MHVTFFPQQVGRLSGKGVDLHPWGLKINSREWLRVVVNVKMLTKYSLPT
jgi:hypothetical protein